METNFLEKVLNNPKNIKTIPVKDINPFKHDFDSECLSNRLHSLYSVLLTNNIDNKLKSILLKYKSELDFLKEVNKPISKNLQEILKNCKP